MTALLKPSLAILSLDGQKAAIMSHDRAAHLLAGQGHGTPAAEADVSEDLVRALITQQHPDLSHLPVRFVAEGWDNAMFRIGEDLCVRLPRRHVAADLLKREQLYLPTFQARLPLPIPATIRHGQPGCGYPWIWSVVPWLRGEPVGTGRLGEAEGVALAQFLKALHRPAPQDAPRSDCRGGPLSTRADLVEFRSGRLAKEFGWIATDILPLWKLALAASDDAAPVWLHGDLHPRNVLMEGGKLSAIIDWGDMCVGDPSTDLAALWLLLPNPNSRALATDIYPATPATMARAKGWAITWGLLLLDTGRVDNREHAAIGEIILQQVLAG